MTANGDEAIQAAEKRAENTRDRNLPQFDDMPIPGDTANLREGANLNDACLALLPLVGVWRGEGEVDYPTIEGPYRFGMQLTIAHDGRPFLIHEARAWLLDEDGKVIRPAARESGFWRPQADDTIELLLTHNTGIVELFYGKPRGKASVPAWELGTDAVVRSSSAKDVTASQRLYGIVNGELGYVEERAMMGQELQPHTSALLRRVVG
ncbi:FABP family protein [Amycolatopsis sp. WAC 01375]|uniref:FABP family protein n=1 Tax=unclassified Amycolatopsis TaxID=2618356 RepID=UPI000F7AEB6D|nr:MULTISPECIES: FABP family protein [unclassified Amycolatopsis]RSM79180.1 FABP family protein [Amycolatopsis sp. WAC 01375]RSN37717.1 FABP family protein [Amycolatopsis sp. WAC 01416]